MFVVQEVGMNIALELHGARLGGLCANGQTGIGWLGQDHCFWCHVEAERGVQEFKRGVLDGRWDREGYTPSKRKVRKGAV